MSKIDFKLYLITDRCQADGSSLKETVRAALQGGVRAVQLREKDLSDEELFRVAFDLRTLTREFGSRLLINARTDVCREVGADGVHLGKFGISIAEARRELGKSCIIGYSAHSVSEALTAEKAGADFVTFGPVFHTPSKAAYGDPVGLAALREACSTIDIPVFALGGVKQGNIASVMAAGANGVALISAIIAAQDPKAEALSLLKVINSS